MLCFLSLISILKLNSLMRQFIFMTTIFFPDWRNNLFLSWKILYLFKEFFQAQLAIFFITSQVAVKKTGKELVLLCKFNVVRNRCLRILVIDIFCWSKEKSFVLLKQGKTKQNEQTNNNNNKKNDSTNPVIAYVCSRLE